MFRSLQIRIAFVATLSLLAFLVVTGLALDRAFKQSALQAVEDRLEAQLFGLLASVEENNTGELTFPDELGEPRFGQPGSGLVAYVADENGERVWSSKSLHGSDMAIIPWFGQGQRKFYQSYAGIKDDPYPFLYGYGVSWEVEDQRTVDYTFLVAESSRRFDQQLAVFRKVMINWLTVGAIVLLIAQLGVLRWALGPIRQLADDVRRVETGAIERLGRQYPSELLGLTDNINEFISNEKRQLVRYRNTLGDLAHSLKTPLAVISSMRHDDVQLLAEVDRMNQIVEHQLQRAAAQGRTTLAAPIPVKPIVDKLISSMQKVYSGKEINLELELDDGVRFFGEEGDLYEILGNLLDNAYKYAELRVGFLAQEIETEKETRPGLIIRIENDGAVVPKRLNDSVAERGVRVDESRPGQGIGLSVVADIVDSYGGTLKIEGHNGLTQVVVVIGAVGNLDDENSAETILNPPSSTEQSD